MLPLLCTLVKGRSPAWHESRLSAEPQHHQWSKHCKHSTFSECHSAQFLIFLLHHTVGLLVTSVTHPTAKCLPKAKEKEPKFSTMSHSNCLWAIPNTIYRLFFHNLWLTSNPSTCTAATARQKAASTSCWETQSRTSWQSWLREGYLRKGWEKQQYA